MGLFDFINNSFDVSKADELLSSWYESTNLKILTGSEDGASGDSITLDRVNLQGLIGAPPIFSEYADTRSDDFNPYGSEYFRRFIEDGNFVAIEAGRPNLYINNEDTSQGTGDGGSKEHIKRLLNLLQDTGGSLYGFETDMSSYWNDVQKLCSMTANMLGIKDVINELGFKNIDNFSWGTDYRSDYIKDYTEGKDSSWNFIPMYHDGIVETGESVSHTTGSTSIEQNINNNVITNNAASNTLKEIAFLTGQQVTDAVDEYDNQTEDQIEQDISLMGKFKNLFTGGMAGLNVKMDLPDVWQDTQYSKEYNLKFKLTTPHGDPVSIWLNVIVPLMHIIPLVSAREIGITNTYTGGYILRIFTEGMTNLNLGMATNVNIERNQKAVSIDGLPTEINVTMTVADLHPMFALPEDMSYSSLVKTNGIMEYLGTLCGYNTARFDFKERIGMKAGASMSDISQTFFPSGIKYNIRSKGKVAIQRKKQDIMRKFAGV